MLELLNSVIEKKLRTQNVTQVKHLKSVKRIQAYDCIHIGGQVTNLLTGRVLRSCLRYPADLEKQRTHYKATEYRINTFLKLFTYSDEACYSVDSYPRSSNLILPFRRRSLPPITLGTFSSFVSRFSRGISHSLH